MKIDTITIYADEGIIRVFINGIGTIDNIKTYNDNGVYLNMKDLMKCLGFKEKQSNEYLEDIITKG
jgi:hypothetical protein